MKIGDMVIDENGYYGPVIRIFPDTGQIAVQQKGRKGTDYQWDNVICTYDSEKQLRPYEPCEGYIPVIPV